jgi:hypothetical protein
MFILSTENESLGRTRMIYLYINGQHVDSLKSKQVKEYNLEPGKYQVQCRMNMYLTEPEIIEVKANGHTAYELTLKSNWKMFAYMIPLLLLGGLINYFINDWFGITWGNLFIVTYFMAIFYINSRISRKGYLELKEIKNNAISEGGLDA